MLDALVKRRFSNYNVNITLKKSGEHLTYECIQKVNTSCYVIISAWRALCENYWLLNQVFQEASNYKLHKKYN